MTVELHLGDCLEVMPSLPSGSVDMIMADLPYGTTACKWDTIIPLEELWKHYKRIIKRNGAIVLTASQPFTSALVMSNPKWFKYAWVWNKNNSAGFASTKYRPFIITEDVCVFCEGTLTYKPQMEIRGNPRKKGWAGSISDCYGIQPISGSVNNTYHPKNLINISKQNCFENDHPTQKPVALMEYLIRTYTNEGETVLDNTMGSGTTGVACINTGRNFIGIEKDAGYFQIATERIEKAQNTMKQMELIA